MAGLTLVTPPASEPLTLTEAKLFARIDGTDEDTLVTDLIAGARRVCEERRGWAFLTQVWDYFLDAFPGHEWLAPGLLINAFPATGYQPEAPIVLPRQPVQAVTSVTYTKSDGTPLVISATDYQVDLTHLRGARVVPVIGRLWPYDVLRSLNGVAVRFTAGYGATAASVPEHMRLAMQQLVAFWYRNRDAIGTIPPAIDELLAESVSGFAYA